MRRHSMLRKALLVIKCICILIFAVDRVVSNRNRRKFVRKFVRVAPAHGSLVIDVLLVCDLVHVCVCVRASNS